MAQAFNPSCKWLSIPNVATLLLIGGGFGLWNGAGPIQAAPPTAKAADNKTDSKQVDAALLEIRKSLAERNFAAAKKQLEGFDAADASARQKAQLQSLRKCDLLLLEFWRSVRSAASQLQPLDEIVLDNQPIALVSEADNESLTLKLGSATKKFAYDKLPPDIAWGIALRFLSVDKAANKAVLGAFLAFDPHGDRGAAGDLWRAAQQGGVETTDLLVELDQPLPTGVAGLANLAATTLVKPGTFRVAAGKAPPRGEVASRPAGTRPAGTNEKREDASASAAAMTPGAPIDLLKAVRLPQDLVRGQASLENGMLVTAPDGHATVQFSQPPPADYLLKVVGEREAGEQVSMGLVVGGHQVIMFFDTSGGKISGLALIGGKRIAENDTAVRGHKLLGSGRKFTIDYEIHASSIVVRLDGQPLCKWSGDSASLSAGSVHASREPDKLNVSTDRAICRFSQVVLTPLLAPGGAASKSVAASATAPREAASSSKMIAGKPIDLLKRLNLARDAVRGQWALNGNAPVSPGKGHPLLQLSAETPTDYMLTIAGQRDEGQAMVVLLVVGGHPVTLFVDGFNRKISGLGRIDGKPFKDNETTCRRANLLGTQAPFTVVCEAHSDSVTVKVNEQLMCEWHGAPERLDRDENWEVAGAEKKLLVGTDNATIRFDKITLTPFIVGGTTTVLTPVAATSGSPRLPLPEDDARKAAVALIKDVYKEDFAKAKKSPEKIALAEKLLTQAGEEPEPVQKFALFAEALTLAQAAGAPGLVAKTVSEIGARYKFDEFDKLAGSLDKLAERSLPKDAWTELSDAARSRIEGAIAAEQFEAAMRLSGLAVMGAKKSGNLEWAKQLAAQGQEIAQQAKQFQAAQDAQKKIATAPADADANQAVGVYLCLVRGNWPDGAPYLTKGADPALRQLAEQELQSPTDPAAQIKLADAWWTLSETAKSGLSMKQAYERRAAYWYLQGRDSLTGLSKARAEKRIKEASSR